MTTVLIYILQLCKHMHSDARVYAYPYLVM